MSEEIIIRHCSPTLAGIKTGNLVGVKYSSYRDMIDDISSINRKLSCKGLRAIPLNYLNNTAQIYIYRPKKLVRDLNHSLAKEILEDRGYTYDCPDRCICQLAKNFKCNKEFPHEIGLFLGYPPEDVKGFIDNKSSNFKLCGNWKVYGDAKKAEKTFSQYKKCKRIYLEQYYKGKTVSQLTVAG